MQVIASVQSRGTLIMLFLLEFTCVMQKYCINSEGTLRQGELELHIEAVRNTPHTKIRYSKAKYGLSSEWGHIATV